jgi:hypothetical protein
VPSGSPAALYTWAGGFVAAPIELTDGENTVELTFNGRFRMA